MSRFWTELGTIAVVLIWAANFTVAKSAFGVLSPIAFTFARFLIAAALLLAIVVAVDRDWRRLARRDWLLAAVAGVLGIGLYQPIWMLGLSLSPASENAVVVATSPLFVLLFAWLRRSALPDRWGLAGFLISFAGVALVILAGGWGVSADAPNRLLGDLLTLGAASLWALYVFLGQDLMQRVPALRATAWATLFGVVAMVPFAWGPVGTVDWTRVPIPGWAAIVYGAALASVFSFVVWYHGVHVLGPVRLMAYQNLISALGVVIAAVALGETLAPSQIGGIVLVLAGLFLVRLPAIRLLRRGRPVTSR